MTGPEVPFEVPPGRYPVVIEVEEIRTTVGWVAGLDALPDLLEALAAELRTMYAETLEVARDHT